MPTKEEILAQIATLKNAKGTLVMDSLIKILEMITDVATAEKEETNGNSETT